jgi:hypothetical protein
MAESNSGAQPPQVRRTIAQIAKQAGLFILFGTMLMIPRVRRLRRRVRDWTFVRLLVAVCGGWLVWRFAYASAGPPTLVVGLVLLAFSLLIRAKPEVKSADALAHELNALIVLNGGSFRRSLDSTPIRESKIFVCSEQIVVLGPHERCLVEIPLAKVHKLAAIPVAIATREGAQPWEVEIHWTSAGPCTTTFRYDGAFAEHLARVTEATLRSQWNKGLAVIAP